MIGSKYVRQALRFYNRNRVNLGYLSFDKTRGEFVIQEGKTNSIVINGVHWGEIYLLKIDNSWKISQCDLDDDGLWKMTGTNITSNNCSNVPVLYVQSKKLKRVASVYPETLEIFPLTSRTKKT